MEAEIYAKKSRKRIGLNTVKSHAVRIYIGTQQIMYFLLPKQVRFGMMK